MSKTTLLSWIRYAVVAAAVLLLARSVPLASGLALLEDKVDGLGGLGAVLFALVYVVAVVAFVPGSVMTLAAGAIFGVVRGTAIVSVASTTGSALAFLLARYLFRARVEAWAAGRPRFRAVDDAIGIGGWRIVALLRLSPAIPFSISNYLYGLTRIRFWPYVGASWVAMLPGTLLYVYLGHAGRAGAEAAAGAGGRTAWEWVLMGAGLVATLVVTVYITRLARQSLARQTSATAEDA